MILFPFQIFKGKDMKRLYILTFLLLIFFLFSFNLLKANEEKRDFNYYKNLTNQLYEKKGYNSLYNFLLFPNSIYEFEKDEKNYNLFSNLNKEEKAIYLKLLNSFKSLDKPINQYKDNKNNDFITFEYELQLNKQATNQDIKEIIEKYTNIAILLYQDNPDLFFTTSIRTTSNYWVYSDYTKIIITIGYKHNFSNYSEKEFLNLLTDYIAQREYLVHEVILKDVNEDGIVSNFEKVKNAHDWLYKNNEYNQKALLEENKNTLDTRMSHRSVSGLLNEFEPVCEGYSFSFKSLMNRVGVSTIIATGKGYSTPEEFEAHAWNYVYLDNYWYLLDATWNDPINANSFTNHHKYFLVNRQEDHILYKKGDVLDGQILNNVVNEPSPLSSDNYNINNQSNFSTNENKNKDTLFIQLNKKDETNIKPNNNKENENTNKNNESKNVEKEDEITFFLFKKLDIFGIKISVFYIVLAIIILFSIIIFFSIIIPRRKK